MFKKNPHKFDSALVYIGLRYIIFYLLNMWRCFLKVTLRICEITLSYTLQLNQGVKNSDVDAFVPL